MRRVLLAAWGLGLAVAFLFFRGLPADPPEWLGSLVRGVDLARLPAWLGAFVKDLAHHPLVGAAGLGRSAGGLALAALIVLSWVGAGRLVLGRRRAAGSLDLAEQCAIGAGAWSLSWFFLGVVGLYRPWIAVAALGIGAALGARALRRHAADDHDPDTRDVGAAPASPFAPGSRMVGGASLAITVLTLVLGLVAALTPPTVKDTLLYHLAVPKAYVAAGRGIDVLYNLASYYPLGHEMQSVWALLLGGHGDPRRIGEAAAGAVAFAWAPILLAIVHGWVRERGLDRAWARVAALLVAAIPTVYHVASSVYVDLALAAYIALAVRATGRWWTTQERSWLRRLALALGWALCIKLTAVFLVVPLAGVVLLRAWRTRAARASDGRGDGGWRAASAVAAAGLAALLVAGVLASPWYVRTWLRTGSPVYPFYVDVGGGSAPGWDRARSYQYEALFAVYGGAEKRAVDYLLAPLRLAVAAQPELPSHYDGVLGVAMLFGLPLVAVALRRRVLDADAQIAAATSAAFLVAWLLGSQQLRYLLPAAPGWALAVVAAGAALTRGRRVVAGALAGLAALGALVIVAWFAEQAPLRVVLGGESRDAFLVRRLDYFPYYQIVNRELPPGARVWLINMRRDTYHLERPYFSDYIFEDWTLRQWVRAARDADDVRRRAREAGFTHVLVRHDLLFDYDRSPIVDDRRPREENLARLALMASFFRDGTRLLRGDRTFWLIELPSAAP